MRKFRMSPTLSLFTAAAMLGASMLPTPAFAAPAAFVANLTGANENPATPSQGSGTAIVILDPAANTLHVTVTFSGLTSGTTASHIHCCQATPGANLNIPVATTTPTFPGFPLGVTSGSYNNTLDLTQASSYNPAFISGAFDPSHTVAGAEAALINGIQNSETYLNIHTVQFPGGELRGLLLAPRLTPLLPAGATNNALAVAGGIDAVFASGSAPAEFVGLLNLPQDELSDMLEHVAGQNASAVAQSGHETVRQFLSLLLNPFAGPGLARQAIPGPGNVWSAAYGSHMVAEGNRFVGSHADFSSGGGFAAGYDFSPDPGTVAGAAFLYDIRSLQVSPDFGHGHSDGYSFALYYDTNIQNYYVSAAADYSLFNAHMSRGFEFSGVPQSYDSSGTAHAFGGRIEAGMHYRAGLLDTTPFAAVLADSVSLPRETETTVSGANTFAIQTASHAFTRVRGEVGIGLNNVELDGPKGPIILGGRIGWAHEFTGADRIPIAFAAFPNQTFTITGAKLSDAAFLAGAFMMPIGPGLTLAGNIQADLASNLNYGGDFQFRYVW